MSSAATGNERLREIVSAAADLIEVLLRGSPGWLDTPAARRLIDLVNAEDSPLADCEGLSVAGTQEDFGVDEA